MRALKIRPEWSASVDAFIRDQAVIGPTLVCPFRTVLREYEKYCKEWGHAIPPTRFLVSHLIDNCPGVTVVDREPTTAGGLGRIVNGLGLMPRRRNA